MSLLALASNVAVAVWQAHRIRTRKLNPLKDEIYADTGAYLKAKQENE